MARGLAMLGMVIAHYVWADGASDGGPAAALARAVDGRAMPLFMLLGGVGVVLVSGRSSHPDRGLVIRAVILLILGLLLDAAGTWIAIVLQFYGLLFLLSPLFRRLSTPVLAVGAVATAAVGAWSYQVVGQPRQATSFESLFDGWPGLRSLLFDGYYPFFPVAGFFLLGLVLARLDLRDRRVAGALAVVGTVVGLGVLWGADALSARWGLDPRLGGDAFVAGRLLDTTGHSAMPAWVISAAGTSVAVLGLSLLAADRAPRLVRPVATVGTVALTFYVFQALATLAVARPSATELSREWLTVAVLYGGFTVVAMVWKRYLRWGPLEALLRIGS